MRKLLKKKKNNNYETVYSFNSAFGATIIETESSLFEGEKDYFVQIIKFDQETEDGYKKVGPKVKLLDSCEIEARLQRLDIMINTRRLKEALANFHKFDGTSDLEFNLLNAPTKKKG